MSFVEGEDDDEVEVYRIMYREKKYVVCGCGRKRFVLVINMSR